MRRLALAMFAAICIFFLVRHGRYALGPERPRDMPAEAQFVQSGYDVEHNEPEGNWVACGLNAGRNANWCRVTDHQGMVVYEGDFLSTRSPVPLALDEIHLAEISPSHLWLPGPAEGGPVPVIPLKEGGFLVPAADREAFQDRWASRTDELQEISAAR